MNKRERRAFYQALLWTFLLFLFIIGLVFFAQPHGCWAQGEPDPTRTCDTASRTPNLGLPRLVDRMAHPEDCVNEALGILDTMIPACPTTTTTTLP